MISVIELGSGFDARDCESKKNIMLFSFVHLTVKRIHSLDK